MTTNYDDIVSGFMSEERAGPPRPDPEPRERRYRIVSVDDHLVEPPDLFTDRLPARLADRAPKVERVDGVDRWVFEDVRVALTTADAHQSWERADWKVGPVSFDQLRRGTWSVKDRIVDMDIGGIDASLCFPSTVFGFAGQRFARMSDPELGLESMRAYNDWIAEEWCAAAPDRLIPCQVAWLADPDVAADEIRRNAARGFRAVAFSENPEKLGFASAYTGEWDPFLAACEETGTVVNLHVGSSSETLVPSPHAPPQALGILFPVNALQACVYWLFSGVLGRFPGLAIALSEGGVGWVPGLIEHLRHQRSIYEGTPLGERWSLGDLTPEELLRRHFWFTTYDSPLSLRLRDEIGVDRIMFESDYPHADSTWPDTQDVVHRMVEGFTADEVDLVTHATASALYRHPMPA